MITLHLGDTIYCKIRGNTVVPVSYDKCDAKIPFELIGISPEGFYILLVPKYYSIKHSWKIERSHAEDCDIDIEFLGKKALAIPKEKIAKVDVRTPINQDGTICVKCGRFYYMAEANQDDGTLICYTCRTNPIRMGTPNKF